MTSDDWSVLLPDEAVAILKRCCVLVKTLDALDHEPDGTILVCMDQDGVTQQPLNAHTRLVLEQYVEAQVMAGMQRICDLLEAR